MPTKTLFSAAASVEVRGRKLVKTSSVRACSQPEKTPTIFRAVTLDLDSGTVVWPKRPRRGAGYAPTGTHVSGRGLNRHPPADHGVTTAARMPPAGPSPEADLRPPRVRPAAEGRCFRLLPRGTHQPLDPLPGVRLGGLGHPVDHGELRQRDARRPLGVERIAGGTWREGRPRPGCAGAGRPAIPWPIPSTQLRGPASWTTPMAAVTSAAPCPPIWIS